MISCILDLDIVSGYQSYAYVYGEAVTTWGNRPLFYILQIKLNLYHCNRQLADMKFRSDWLFGFVGLEFWFNNILSYNLSLL